MKTLGAVYLFVLALFAAIAALGFAVWIIWEAGNAIMTEVAVWAGVVFLIAAGGLWTVVLVRVLTLLADLFQWVEGVEE